MTTKKVLIVDDSETVRAMTRVVLRNYQVESAVDGEDGLVMYRQVKPDVIITDFNMPRMNGEEFLKEIRKVDKTTPVIFLTTESDDDLRARMISHGANGWMVKPMKIDVLLHTVSLAVT